MMLRVRIVLVTLTYVVFLTLIKACKCYVECNNRVDLISSTKQTGYISYKALGVLKGDELFIYDNVDMDGKICELPSHVTLNLRSGSLANGVLIGNRNRLIISNGVFDNVTIKGSWNSPIIKSTYFKDLSKVNSLKNVFALTNPDIHNKVYISSGDYYVESLKEWDICLLVNSNTELFIDGTIKMLPNSFIGCNVLVARGDNIKITGKGTIVGDRETHKGDKGEWGFGINILEARNVRVSGLNVKDCWGDCIYVGGKSKNVLIENCTLSGSRRQGISITSADGVKIYGCEISDIEGTEPEYAIDVEPDPGEYCDKIMIENVNAFNCKGGFMVYGRVPKTKTGSVSIKDCKVSHVSKSALRFIDCNRIYIDNCTVQQASGNETVYFDKVKKISKKDIFIK